MKITQDWMDELPLRYQGTLLMALRGCDVAPKRPLDSLERRIVAAIRYYVMNAADPREVDFEPGAFMMSEIPEPKSVSGIGHYPQHWFSHVWHAIEVLGYCYPVPEIRKQWFELYLAFCKDQHVPPESPAAMHDRLTEDRVITGSVVS
jgi:hypothetical protein